MCFIKEAVKFEEKEKYLWFASIKLSSGQTTMKGDSTICRGGKTFKEACQITCNHVWKWMDKIDADHNIYWVKGHDKGKHAWHCVLLREVFIFETQNHCEAGMHSMDLLEYGKILRSGWGEDPPKSAIKEIDKQYCV